MLTSLYRRFVSKELRDKIYQIFLGDLLFFFRNISGCLRCKYYSVYYSIVKPKNEKESTYKLLGEMGLSPYPYVWRQEYDKTEYPSYVDVSNGLPYVIHNQKRLYFRRDMSDIASDIYRSLLVEQDKRSAHCYVNSNKELEHKILLDVGSAEACFALEMIDFVDHAYLFECDEKWIEALEATFAPWKDKITFIRKYVSDHNDDNNITLDEFFKDKPSDNLFIKMDIEGFERKALQGSKELMQKSKNISGSVCIYHLHDDEEIVGGILHENACTTTIQPGYLYFENELRHAVMHFCKN